MKGLAILLLFSGALCSMLTTSIAIDTLSPIEDMRDGDTIVSSGGMFELGFFSPGNSQNRYLGIWYKKVSNGTVVWVANRVTPLNTTSGFLKVSSDGILQLVSVGNNTNSTIWSSSFAYSNNINNPVAQLLDTGNLVIREESRTLWQSFDYPGDTYLPGMKVGKDLITGIDRQFISWKSLDDPSPGQFVLLMDTNGFPQILEKRGSVFHTRFGPWNGARFSGMPSLIKNPTSVRSNTKRQDLNGDSIYDGRKEDIDLPSFSLSVINKSTSNFSIINKLGEGGFGPVYKGVLEDGRKIAVKRLSKSSRQGIDEFKNEVRCIAKLQHRNLVKLLGYCIQGDETMLIYEYMANKSLDFTIFDISTSSMLGWPQRFNIILGIARGLLYLHQDSRLRVIHRDLKAANILLDDDMNPKISDFGLARRFKGYETKAKTNKVVGTYGYIAPEYAVHGLFSIKSDVFSFGVLVLEIVSGQKNRGFSHEQHSDNLLGHAWRLFKEDKSLELASSELRSTWANSEILRSIHIGLLCVQNHADDRPTMSSIVVMLDQESTLPPPKQPAFFTEVSLIETKAPSSTATDNSNNNVTITVLEAR